MIITFMIHTVSATDNGHGLGPHGHGHGPLLACVSRTNDFECPKDTKKTVTAPAHGHGLGHGLGPGTRPRSRSRSRPRTRPQPRHTATVTVLFWPALAGQMISSVRRTRRKRSRLQAGLWLSHGPSPAGTPNLLQVFGQTCPPPRSVGIKPPGRPFYRCSGLSIVFECPKDTKKTVI